MFQFESLKELAKDGVSTSSKPKVKNRRTKSIDFKLGLYNNQNGLCAICNTKMSINNYNIDHINPLSKGGTNKESNLQLTHVCCNSKKGSKIK